MGLCMCLSAYMCAYVSVHVCPSPIHRIGLQCDVFSTCRLCMSGSHGPVGDWPEAWASKGRGESQNSLSGVLQDPCLTIPHPSPTFLSALSQVTTTYCVPYVGLFPDSLSSDELSDLIMFFRKKFKQKFLLKNSEL